MISIESYVLEYVMIVNFLLSKENQNAFVKGNILYIHKEKLVEMMNKNRFDEAENKMALWKGLKWIVCEGRYYTKRVYISDESGKKGYNRLVNVDLAIHSLLKDKVNAPAHRAEQVGAAAPDQIGGEVRS